METDCDVATPWITKRTKFMIKEMGQSAALYYGWSFKFIKIPNLDPPFISHAQAAAIKVAKITAIVVSAANKNIWAFQVYDSVEHRVLPSENSGQIYYVPCHIVMNNLVFPHVELVSRQWYGLSVESALVGRTIIKRFKGVAYSGRITALEDKLGFYGVCYADGDREEMELQEVIRYLRC